jgi:Homeodomain-like domain
VLSSPNPGKQRKSECPGPRGGRFHPKHGLADEGEHGPGRTNASIVAALGVGERTVERIRKRFVTESFEAALNPSPQPRRPDKVKIQGPVEKQLVQLACSDPPSGRCRWTLQLLADQMVVLGCLDRVSTETIRTALKKTTSPLGL